MAWIEGSGYVGGVFAIIGIFSRGDLRRPYKALRRRTKSWCSMRFLVPGGRLIQTFGLSMAGSRNAMYNFSNALIQPRHGSQAVGSQKRATIAEEKRQQASDVLNTSECRREDEAKPFVEVIEASGESAAWVRDRG